MNKVNVIKQNLEFIGKTWMKCIGTFASILSLFFLFWTWDDIRITSTQYKCVIIILLCVSCTHTCNPMDVVFLREQNDNLGKSNLGK